MRYGLDEQGSEIRFPVGKRFSCLRDIHRTGSAELVTLAVMLCFLFGKYVVRISAGTPVLSVYPYMADNTVNQDNIIYSCAGSHPALCVMGTVVPFFGTVRPGCQAYHSSPSSAQNKNVWTNISVPYVFYDFMLN